MGAFFSSVITQSIPPKTKYTVEDIPDLSDKTVLITGGNTGVGFETARAVLRKNAVVYIACRSRERGLAAVAKLKGLTGKTANLLILDLASLSSVKTAAEEFLSKESKLDILFNNAGVLIPPHGLTQDGYDMTFGTNVVGHFYLTKLLLPALLAVGQQNSSKTARVVNVSSIRAEFTSKLDYSAFKANGKLSAQTMYNQSKFANAVFAAEFARRYGDKGIVTTALNPGGILTDIQRNVPSIITFLTNWTLYPPEKGALTQLYAGTAPEGDEFNGKYLIPWARLFPPPPGSQDEKTGKELWDWLDGEIEGFVAKSK